MVSSCMNLWSSPCALIRCTVALTRKRHIPPHSAQSQHTNYWAPRTRKRHQQEHRPHRPTERSDPTQHAKGRTGDRPRPREGATTRRNVTQGVVGPLEVARGEGTYVVTSHEPSPWWTCTTCQWPGATVNFLTLLVHAQAGGGGSDFASDCSSADSFDAISSSRCSTFMPSLLSEGQAKHKLANSGSQEPKFIEMLMQQCRNIQPIGQQSELLTKIWFD